MSFLSQNFTKLTKLTPQFEIYISVLYLTISPNFTPSTSYLRHPHNSNLIFSSSFWTCCYGEERQDHQSHNQHAVHTNTTNPSHHSHQQHTTKQPKTRWTSNSKRQKTNTFPSLEISNYLLLLLPISALLDSKRAHKGHKSSNHKQPTSEVDRECGLTVGNQQVGVHQFT